MRALKIVTLLFAFGLIPLQLFSWNGMPTPPLHVDGRYLKDPNGKIVSLHGWMQPTSSFFNGRFFRDPVTFTPEDCAESLNVYKSIVDLLSNTDPLFGRSHGWYNNFVRIWTPSDGWRNDGTVDEALQDRAWNNMYIPYVEHCRSRGIYVVFVGNCPDGGTFMSAQHKSNMIKFWTRICNRYPAIKNADNVMFEIANEPVTIESQLGNGDWGSVSDAHDRAVQAYFQDIVNAIRGTGANNIIWVPGLIWQDRLMNFATYPIVGNNIGYAGHMYPFGGDNPTEINNRFVSSGWKACSDKYPVIVTEGSWHTMAEDQGIRRGTTEGFGITVKNFYDTQGNISWICGMTEELIGNMSAGISGFTYPEINSGRAGFDWWPSYISSAPGGGGCTPSTITPYIQVNDGSWQQTSSVTVNSGVQVRFGPQPVSGGSWSWNGCGTSGNSREQTVSPTGSCTATVTYTNTCGAQSTQTFTINVSGSGEGTFNGVYSIVAQHSDKAVNVSSGGTSNGTNVQQWAYTASNNNQRFQVTHLGGGWHQISPVIASGQALDVSGVSTANGANVHTWAWGSGNNQQWKFESVGNGYFRIIARHSNKCLDVSGVSTADGANVHQWDCLTGAQNQAFQLIQNGSARIALEGNRIFSEGSGTSDFTVFPNPSNSGEFSITISDEDKELYRLNIFSVDGKKLYETEKLGAGTHKISTDLQRGMYLLKLGGRNRHVKKFIVL